MIRLALTLTVALVRASSRSQLELRVENLALRQQVAVFKQQHCRPRLRPADRIFWVFLRRAWRNWANALTVSGSTTMFEFQRWQASFRVPGVEAVPALRCSSRLVFHTCAKKQ